MKRDKRRAGHPSWRRGRHGTGSERCHQQQPEAGQGGLRPALSFPSWTPVPLWAEGDRPCSPPSLRRSLAAGRLQAPLPRRVGNAGEAGDHRARPPSQRHPGRTKAPSMTPGRPAAQAPLQRPSGTLPGAPASWAQPSQRRKKCLGGVLEQAKWYLLNALVSSLFPITGLSLTLKKKIPLVPRSLRSKSKHFPQGSHILLIKAVFKCPGSLLV